MKRIVNGLKEFFIIAYRLAKTLIGRWLPAKKIALKAPPIAKTVNLDLS